MNGLDDVEPFSFGHGLREWAWSWGLSISSTLLSDSPLSSLAARLMIDACCLHSSQQNRLGLIANPVCWNLTSHSGFSQTISESNEDAIPTACTVSIINDQRFGVSFPLILHSFSPPRIKPINKHEDKENEYELQKTIY